MKHLYSLPCSSLPVFAAAARIQAHEALLDAATNGDTAFIINSKGMSIAKETETGTPL